MIPSIRLRGVDCVADGTGMNIDIYEYLCSTGSENTHCLVISGQSDSQ
jgi:hypothetical protein